MGRAGVWEEAPEVDLVGRFMVSQSSLFSRQGVPRLCPGFLACFPGAHGRKMGGGTAQQALRD